MAMGTLQRYLLGGGSSLWVSRHWVHLPSRHATINTETDAMTIGSQNEIESHIDLPSIALEKSRL